MKDTPYFPRVRLLLAVLPLLAEEGCPFALKGGTAINLFLRDMPRLSVDIDLTYVPIEDRERSLRGMHQALKRIAEGIAKTIPNVKVTATHLLEGKYTGGFLVTSPEAQIKIEPNHVLRGCVYPCETRKLCPEAESLFAVSVAVPNCSFADIYGGKICAALDRQHPRDLFDVKVLFENEGITEKVRKAFVIYLAGHNRPMSELLKPSLLDIEQIFEDEFQGMTRLPVKYEELVRAREMLIATLHRDLTNDERKFILSVKEGSPSWSMLEVEGVERLPAIQWKLLNIRKMDSKKHAAAVEKLREALSL